MSGVRLRARKKSEKERAREIQGMLAMHGLESETEQEQDAEGISELRTEPSGTEPELKPRARRATEVKPLPYRMVLATWPDHWRESWGRRANELEESGLSWRDAEGRAFVETWGRLRAASDVERN